MIPDMRRAAPAEVTDEMLATSGLTRRDVTIPGYLGDEITVSVIAREDHQGLGPGIYHTHGGGMVSGAAPSPASTGAPRTCGRSHILNTSSISGLIPMAGVAAYTSSKFASVGLSMALREELAGTDVGVSLLVPGAVATPINFNAGAAEAKLLGREMDAAVAEKNSALLLQGADPGRVGEQVVEAMQQKQFMVVTHREWGPFAAHVHREIERAYEEFDGRHGPDPVATAMAAGEETISS
ncbi:SDR family NAD(P)-dependent oxidoreductase [Streptomyces rochei]